MDQNRTGGPTASTQPNWPGASNPSSLPPTGGSGRATGEIAEEASAAIDDVRRRAGDAAESARQRVREAVSQVKGQASDATHAALSQLKQHGQRAVADQKDRTASTLTDIGDALHKASDRLRQEEDNNIASYIDALAGASSRAGSYLRDADVSRLVGDVQGVARRYPGLFFGGMFLAGLAVARFAKASRPESRGYGDERRGEFGRQYRPGESSSASSSMGDFGSQQPGQYGPSSSGLEAGRAFESSALWRDTPGGGGAGSTGTNPGTTGPSTAGGTSSAGQGPACDPDWSQPNSTTSGTSNPSREVRNG